MDLLSIYYYVLTETEIRTLWDSKYNDQIWKSLKQTQCRICYITLNLKLPFSEHRLPFIIKGNYYEAKHAFS